MPAAPIRRSAAGQRAYFYQGLVPLFCLVCWLVLVLLAKKHLSESSIYQALHIGLYVSGAGALALVAIPIGFRKSAGLLKLVLVSLFCGLLLALITFVGYMTVGFG